MTVYEKFHWCKHQRAAQVIADLMHKSHTFLLSFCYPFCPRSPGAVVTKEFYWLMVKLIVIEEKYFCTVGILLNFETASKTSESFLYPLTTFVQGKIFKFLPTRCSFRYGLLNNGKDNLAMLVLCLKWILSIWACTHIRANTFYKHIVFIWFLTKLWNYACNTVSHIFLPFTDTEAMISAEPKTFSPWQTYFPSSDLEAFRIRRLPSGRIAILKIIKKGFFLFYCKSAK